ncbi:hypothetical protein OHA40_00190 [Nocardia sp. NBC_00508]|uniref:hypothetical protein n=1 Tax=Nocardia sp. NBC_00508 TaxID=2975992 RepID=UPI002E8217D5|nr:hypothetical protein [Nocardia sp. NBC_00508]WUD66640.1 hypothetical protein OHA40_00190 [Nocardia sp. NBC_00508]
MTDSPRSIAEIDKALPSGEGQEGFSGYGVMGMPFASGHYLALRHFPASSVGEGYDAVWHRDPAGEWVIYSSVSPEVSCARYFGSALEDARTERISVTWTGPFAFTVEVQGRLVWDVELGRSAATVAMTGLGRKLPTALWRRPAVLSLMSRVAGPVLGVGRVRLIGTSPNGQWFRANPRRLWIVENSGARIGGIDIGPPGPLAEQARLGDFWLPQRGMFVVGESYFEQYDAARHQAARPGS